MQDVIIFIPIQQSKLTNEITDWTQLRKYYENITSTFFYLLTNMIQYLQTIFFPKLGSEVSIL